LSDSATKLKIKIVGFLTSLQLIIKKFCHFTFRCCAPCCKNSCWHWRSKCSFLSWYLSNGPVENYEVSARV